MPIEKTRCDGCNDKQNECPECGGKVVTPLDEPGMDKPTELAIYGPDGKYTYTNICWDCGWSEEVTVTVSREGGGQTDENKETQQ